MTQYNRVLDEQSVLDGVEGMKASEGEAWVMRSRANWMMSPDEVRVFLLVHTELASSQVAWLYLV
jgi:hypothetical protein